MPVRLVGCAVLRVQEGRLVYPSCNHCYSRTDVQLQDHTRCACSKCGYSCPKAQVGYRYRLRLRVSKEASIFGLTVFGTCLDPFFGIHASGLQRLMEEEDEPVEAATRAALLKQAVEDCFIGRHLIFGIKVNDTGSSPWFDGSSRMTGGATAGPAQFIATQVLVPPAGGGAGCSVLRYYHALLQRAGPPGSPGRSSTAAPLLLPLRSPGRTARTTPPHSRLLSCSLHRLMDYDSVLSPDSPWQRSLGVVTSSAEQDTQNDEDDEPDSRPPHRPPLPNQTPAETQRAPPAPLPSANERGFSIGHSFTHSLCSPDAAEAPSVAPILPTGPSPLPSPLVNRSPARWPQHGVDAPACLSLPWEDDMALSESLEAFIACQENPPESRAASPTRCHSNRQASTRHSRRRTSVDVSNITPESARRAIEGACMRGTPACGGLCSPVSCKPMGAQGFCVDILGPALDGDNTEDVYNCSADLFSDPVAVVTVATQVLGASAGTTAANGQMVATHEDTQILNANTEAPASTQRRAGSNLDNAASAAPSDRRLESSVSAALPFLYTPHKHGVGSSRCRAADSNERPALQPRTPTDDVIHGSDPDPLDFVPPLQSTPLPRLCVQTVSGSASAHRTTRAACRPLGCLQPDRQPPCIITTPSRHRFTASPLHRGTQRYLQREDPVASSNTPARKNHQNQNLKLTSRRRLRNQDRANRGLTARQSGKLQRATASGPAGVTDVSVTVMCVGDGDNNDTDVTPPRIGEMPLPVSARQGEHTDGCIRQTQSWHISGARTNAVDSKTRGRSAEVVRRDGSLHHFRFDQSQEFDLSSDLFADSFH